MTKQQKLAAVHHIARQYMAGSGPLAEPESIAAFLRKAHASFGFTPEDVEALS